MHSFIINAFSSAYKVNVRVRGTVYTVRQYVKCIGLSYVSAACQLTIDSVCFNDSQAMQYVRYHITRFPYLVCQ